MAETAVFQGPERAPLILSHGANELVPELKKHNLRVTNYRRVSSLLTPTRHQDARLILIGPESLAEIDLELTLPRIRNAWPLVDIVIWCPRASGSTVRSALNAGAKDVVLKASEKTAAHEIRSVIDSQQLLPRAARLDHQSEQPSSFHGILSRSRRMWDLFDTATQMAASDATVLILGETGTGKELLARAIHRRSERSGRFVAINCGAVNENLIDAELFGYEKGAFTGAAKDRDGLFRHASDGTLMLDEIGNIPLNAQYRLLRVLQEGMVRPVGAQTEVPIDVRVIAATSSSLEKDVQQGRFREDLFYRIDVLRLEIPPLRDRPNDIIYLFGHFAKRVAEQYNIERPDVSDGFLDALTSYGWPGNVRQLENFTERLVLTKHSERVTADTFAVLIPFNNSKKGPAVQESSGRQFEIDPSKPLRENIDPAILEIERSYLSSVLRETAGRIGVTAERAGMSRRTLLRKMNAHGLSKTTFRSSTQDETE